AAMQRRQDRIADQLRIERHVEDQRAILDPRRDAQPRAIGHAAQDRVRIGISGARKNFHHVFSGNMRSMSMKVPVAMATGSSSEAWNARARANAISCVILRHSDSIRMSVFGVAGFM